ncbi:MAG: hypothetical protein AB1422_09195, partial [bacterium]
MGTNEDENRFDGLMVQVKSGSGHPCRAWVVWLPAFPSPESRTPNPESRFSEEPFSLQPNYGHGKRTRFTNFQCFICVHLWLNSYPG